MAFGCWVTSITEKGNQTKESSFINDGFFFLFFLQEGKPNNLDGYRKDVSEGKRITWSVAVHSVKDRD